MKHKNKIISLRPFCFLTPSVSTISVTILCILLPQILMLFLTRSFNSLLLLCCSITASLATEAVDKLCIRKQHFSVLPVLIQGILIGLFIPADYPPVAFFFLTAIMLLLTKYVFGLHAGSWINTTAATIIAAYFIGSVWFPAVHVPVEQIQSPNMSLLLIQEGVLPVYRFDSAITGFLNEHIFSALGTAVPDGYISLLWDSGSAIPAFRFNILTLIGSLFLFSFRILDALIPALFIGVYLGLVRLFCPVFAGGMFGTGDCLLALLTGGTLFTAFFILPWFGTVPMTTCGKVFYGIFAGIAAFFISGFGLSTAGAVFTVFSANIVSVLIQFFEQKMSDSVLYSKKLPKIQSMQELRNGY